MNLGTIPNGIEEFKEITLDPEVETLVKPYDNFDDVLSVSVTLSKIKPTMYNDIYLIIIVNYSKPNFNGYPKRFLLVNQLSEKDKWNIIDMTFEDRSSGSPAPHVIVPVGSSYIDSKKYIDHPESQIHLQMGVQITNFIISMSKISEEQQITITPIRSDYLYQQNNPFGAHAIGVEMSNSK